MPLISAQEVAAHGAIRELLTKRVARRITRHYTEVAFSRLCAVFAPRCNCGGILSVARMPGRNVLVCYDCGFRVSEYPIDEVKRSPLLGSPGCGRDPGE